MARHRSLVVFALCPLLAACEPAALAVLGGGAGTILRYNLDGIAARTFTAPAPVVRSASLAAAGRMGLSIEATDTIDTGEVIRARAAKLRTASSSSTSRMVSCPVMSRAGATSARASASP